MMPNNVCNKKDTITCIKKHTGLCTTPCRVALHLQRLVVTLNAAYSIHHLRYTVVIITFTSRYTFLDVLFDNITPSMLWVPDGLR